MRNVDPANKAAKKVGKTADPASRLGGFPDRRSAALARGARPNARRLPTRNMTRGR
ncbi:hypothetical protein [Thermomonospora cellulosilytica]|uniref:Uncharacterized protein n=1 Tax=Thermomonospora cellulosilytica TaxID=1411118 RepID=A0A7W3MV46_9ACTN|nr:hypothetical protein [Thermomonospora cellulosilytica]MBA9002436.1 hypothetical protein [Thermomonospora cellulosilytica]